MAPHCGIILKRLERENLPKSPCEDYGGSPKPMGNTEKLHGSLTEQCPLASICLSWNVKRAQISASSLNRVDLDKTCVIWTSKPKRAEFWSANEVQIRAKRRKCVQTSANVKGGERIFLNARSFAKRAQTKTRRNRCLFEDLGRVVL